tara:strand:- start:1666 stop:4533 length:2868 start_codon:yes stop_codon:yes gene_type:complete
MAENRVFVSPGVYTSERDLSFVTRQVGVTTLGLVGETTVGPAFQPVFVTNYDEFKTFFGGQNATKFKDTGYPKYELPYIAKSYLSQSNQLFVTRILGFSGYDAGEAWGITLDAALDPSTVVSTSGATYTGFSTDSLITYYVSSGGTLTYTSSDLVIDTLLQNGALTANLSFLASAATGATTTVACTYTKVGNTFIGRAFSLYVTDIVGSGATTGYTSGVTTVCTGTSYLDVDDTIVALLRSRGEYGGEENILFEVTGSTSLVDDYVVFGSTPTDAASNPMGNFALTGHARTLGNFTYNVSFDKTKINYISKVLGRGEKDGKTALYVEEIYQNMMDKYIDDNKIYGINLTLIDYASGTPFQDYLEEYKPAVTPYIVSELRGSNLLRLFRLWTISDGDSANQNIKISITNIKPDDKEFDIEVRNFFDTDANKVVLEKYSRLVMDPTSQNYIAKRIGTLDGDYASKSSYILVELDDTSDTSDAFPAGFIGVPQRDYHQVLNTGVTFPDISYKQTYGTYENKRKVYLGLSNIVGIDQDFFDYKGLPNDSDLSMWTGLTKGFHMDVDATGATIDGVEVVYNSSGDTYSPVFLFDTGCCEFRTDTDVNGTAYEKIYARKFTLAPYGGFDGWDIYRDRRTNKDNYRIDGTRGEAGLLSGAFANRALTNGDNGITSDYYAYLEAIWTFNNPESVNINVFATPGIDNFENTNLVEETIEMIEQDRADSLYIVTTPDVDSGGQVLTAEEVVDSLSEQFDSSYTATYFPWVQVNDAENNVYIYLPATRDVVRNIALTDNIAFPWYAVAGIQRGNVDAIKARAKLTLQDRDTLYAGRVNPVTTFASDGIKIWGNKTLQVKESALDRINVRRLLLQARKLISAVSIRLLFEQNDDIVRNQFLGLVNPILDNIRKESGLADFRVVLDDTPESRDRNELVGRIFIKPTRALEFICVEFNIMNTGASFDDV